jgi:hypothetical protein
VRQSSVSHGPTFSRFSLNFDKLLLNSAHSVDVVPKRELGAAHVPNTYPSMVQAVKSLAKKASQIASTSASVVRKFPPREAVFSPSAHTNFLPETWANLQRASEASVSAFVHRIGLSRVLTDLDEVRLACTHSSYPPFYAMHNPKEPPIRSNANLASLGNSLLGLFASEYVHSSYPHLPTRVMKAAVSAYVGPLSSSNIAREMGAQPLLRWNRPVRVFASRAWFKLISIHMSPLFRSQIPPYQPSTILRTLSRQSLAH